MIARKGLKAIALFEASKGMVSLVVGLGIHTLGGANLRQSMESLLLQMHLNPAAHMPGIILQEASKLSHSNLSLIALGALVYSLVRFVEAYGLWLALAWTEWLAFMSGAIYLPFEIYELTTRPSALIIFVLTVNSLIVWYLYRTVRTRTPPRPVN